MTKLVLTLPVTRWERPDHGVTLRCDMIYDMSDPLVVTMSSGDAGVLMERRVLARDLLSDGLNIRTRAGDVELWPLFEQEGEPDLVCLRHGGGTAVSEIPAEPLQRWLEATYALVPPGAELDDADWHRLLQLAE
ncbi:SsgA family sporulation/cell division regulator [Streptomyces longispororuber]|uniref:SsgA family sporulation/cell division regulator n=1 Tax=Streptomyces longispororuber TaxID=68230 RepID=UPI00210991AE|nr:SsgA family sporulation/cell division regulator [Streptomyces longispororuber]MCQ4212813.1 SsgA family sporulation/cell division regulator [Streptomyces longispororuber]